MAKASRDKGKRGEGEVVDLFQTVSLDAYREAPLQAGEVEGARDVAVRAFPSLHVEVKRCERYELPKWERQVEEAVGDGEVPVIFYRRNKQPWRAVVPGQWLARTLSRLHALERFHEAQKILDDAELERATHPLYRLLPDGTFEAVE